MEMFLDRQGKPMTANAYEFALQDARYRWVRRTLVASGEDLTSMYEVSTVWLGINIDLDGTGKPALFETRIFRSSYARNYSTEESALRGHEHAIDIASEGIPEAVIMEI